MIPHIDAIIPVPNNPDHAEKIIHQIKPRLIILTGGNNINPEMIGKSIIVPQVVPNRDATETILLDYAFKSAVPVIGICRGFQFINVYLGGGITYYLTDNEHIGQHDCFYGGIRFNINSFHEHGILTSELSKELKAEVKCDGDVIEACSGKIRSNIGNSNVLGVQWHPERPGANLELFKELFMRYVGV